MSARQADSLPPHSDEAERGLLSCLLADPSILPQLKAAGLTPGWFFDLKCRKTLNAIDGLLQNGARPDFATIVLQLRKDRQFAEPTAFLHELEREVTSAQNAPYWLPILREKAARRTVLAACARLNDLAKDETTDASAVFNDAQTALESFRRCLEEAALPEIVSASELIADEQIRMPREIISGVLHQGSKLILGGSSKSYKTWTLLDLAVSVAAGAPWLGFETLPSKVLYLNFEIATPFFRRRIADVSEAKKVTLNGSLDLWNLRGHAADYRFLLPKIRTRIVDEGHALLILDPTYKLLGAADENSARDIAALLNAIEALTVSSGAAIAMASHFAKGNASAKETIDRISGSGVFARDPDSLLIFTKHEEEGAFAVETVLRNLPPLPPFVVRWNCPLFERAGELNPEKLKQQPGGRPRKHTPESLLEVLGARRLTTTEWRKRASDTKGIAKTSFFDLLEDLQKAGRILKSTIDEKWEKLRPKSGKSGKSEN
jgi:hypothetical protein